YVTLDDLSQTAGPGLKVRNVIDPRHVPSSTGYEPLNVRKAWLPKSPASAPVPVASDARLPALPAQPLRASDYAPKAEPAVVPPKTESPAPLKLRITEDGVTEQAPDAKSE